MLFMPHKWSLGTHKQAANVHAATLEQDRSCQRICTCKSPEGCDNEEFTQCSEHTVLVLKSNMIAFSACV